MRAGGWAFVAFGLWACAPPEPAGDPSEPAPLGTETYGERVEGALGPEGGTWVVPLAEGSATLTIPPRAVAEPVAISVQPALVGAIGGAVAVEILPSGLSLDVPGTLVFSTAPGASDVPLGFAFSEGAATLEAHLAVAGTEGLVTWVDGFSTHGAAPAAGVEPYLATDDPLREIVEAAGDEGADGFAALSLGSAFATFVAPVLASAEASTAGRDAVLGAVDAVAAWLAEVEAAGSGAAAMPHDASGPETLGALRDAVRARTAAAVEAWLARTSRPSCLDPLEEIDVAAQWLLWPLEVSAHAGSALGQTFEAGEPCVSVGLDFNADPYLAEDLTFVAIDVGYRVTADDGRWSEHAGTFTFDVSGATGPSTVVAPTGRVEGLEFARDLGPPRAMVVAIGISFVPDDARLPIPEPFSFEARE